MWRMLVERVIHSRRSLKAITHYTTRIIRGHRGRLRWLIQLLLLLLHYIRSSRLAGVAKLRRSLERLAGRWWRLLVLWLLLLWMLKAAVLMASKLSRMRRGRSGRGGRSCCCCTWW